MAAVRIEHGVETFSQNLFIKFSLILLAPPPVIISACLGLVSHLDVSNLSKDSCKSPHIRRTRADSKYPPHHLVAFSIAHLTDNKQDILTNRLT